MPDKKKISFVDAQKMQRMHPKTFECPTEEECQKITFDDSVKIAVKGERFWTKVMKVDWNGNIYARIDNDLILSKEHKLNFGDEVVFQHKHVHNIIPGKFRPQYRNLKFKDAKEFDKWLKKKTKWIVNFEDGGQDFSRWHIDERGEIIHSNYQGFVWVGKMVDIKTIKVGKYLRFLATDTSINYKVLSLKTLKLK